MQSHDAKVGVGADVDLDKILLPKKGPHPDTTARVNAGAVLEASMPLSAAPKAPASPEALRSLRQDIRSELKETAAPAAPAVELPRTPQLQAPEPKPADAPVAAVRTYKGDIEETVREKNVSLVSIAAAQARRGTPVAPKSEGRSYAMVGVGLVLIVLSLGVLAYLFIPREAATPDAPEAMPPLIHVDATMRVEVRPNQDRLALMDELVTDRENVKLSLGLVARLYVVQSATSSVSGIEGEYPASAFLGLLAPHAPSALLRSLFDRFLLGVHSFDGNQPFLIFKTASYQQTYAGMLEWERDMQGDLLPLFERKPRVRIPEEGTTTPVTAPQVTETEFADAIVENHDARVIHNAAGDILLMWSFVNRETLVIATNEYSLREAITRLKSPPLVPIPN